MKRDTHDTEKVQNMVCGFQNGVTIGPTVAVIWVFRLHDTNIRFGLFWVDAADEGYIGFANKHWPENNIDCRAKTKL